MAPPRWIHCNLCFYLMIQRERKFYHLSCRHVLCKPCMAKTDRGTICPVCKEPLSRFTELNNQMDRKEKMYYEPGALKAFNNAAESVTFQHQQRENMIKGILSCKKKLPQLKEMEGALRERIVATQRQYEKMRAYRRNLQEILRQSSPAYGGTAPLPVQTPVVVQGPSQMALSNRPRERDSSRSELLPPSVLPETSDMVTPTVRNAQGSERFDPTLSSKDIYPQAGNPSASGLSRHGKLLPPGGGGFSNDSGISGMRSPTSSTISRSTGAAGNHHQFPLATPIDARRPQPFHSNQLPSSYIRR